MHGYGWTAVTLALTLFACGEGGDDIHLAEVSSDHPTTGGASGGETPVWTAGTAPTAGNSASGAVASVGGGSAGLGGRGGANDLGWAGAAGAGGNGGRGAGGPSGGVGGGGESARDSCVYIDTSPLEATARQLYGLEINGSGFDAHDGQLARLAIWTNPDWIAVAQERVVGGAFKFELPLALTDYSSVGLYIDEDDSDACSDGEPTWSYTSGAGACTAQPCPPPGGTHVENLRLPLDECTDCGPWRVHPLVELGVDDYCATATGNDLTDALPCPL